MRNCQTIYKSIYTILYVSLKKKRGDKMTIHARGPCVYPRRRTRGSGVSMHPRHAHFKGQTAEKANPTCRRRSVHCSVWTSFTSSAVRVSSYRYRGILEKAEINTDVCASRRDNWRIWLELKRRLSAIYGFCCVQRTSLKGTRSLPPSKTPL